MRTLSSVWLERSAHNRVVSSSNLLGSICDDAENYVGGSEAGIGDLTCIAASSPPHREKISLGDFNSEPISVCLFRVPLHGRCPIGRWRLSSAYTPYWTRSSVRTEHRASNGSSGIRALLGTRDTTAPRRYPMDGGSNPSVSVSSPVV